MDLMRRRREILAQGGELDTSPKILEYGKRLKGATGIETDADWCYTDWIYCTLDGQTVGENKLIEDAYASSSTGGVYQYEKANGTYDYWFGSADFTPLQRNIGSFNIIRIRWSIKIENLSKCYAYMTNTGQIFFAGKNSIYYGYTNLNDMPT